MLYLLLIFVEIATPFPCSLYSTFANKTEFNITHGDKTNNIFRLKCNEPNLLYTEDRNIESNVNKYYINCDQNAITDIYGIKVTHHDKLNCRPRLYF